jgi:hypothetical protein
METPTHLDYPELGYPTRLAEGLASNAAWDAIAAQIGTGYIRDTAVFDFPTDLIKVSDTEYKVTCYVATNATPRPKTTVRIIQNADGGWGAL